MNFDEKMQFYKSLTEKELERYTNFTDDKQQRLYDAMKYSLQAGGKRIRPILALEFCNICCGDYKKAIPAACAIEMIHTFSLIHDDLPCIDNDDMRRGRASCHKAFDETTALLAGDALEMFPFEVITDGSNYGVSHKNIVKQIIVLSQCAGHRGMIGGQQIDTQFEGQKLSLEELLNMYKLKTSRLLQAAACMGCFAGDADNETAKKAYEYCDRIGLAFQIVDDILDMCGDEKILGKHIGSDKENGKQTYAAVVGLETAKKEAQRLTEEAYAILDDFNNCEFLKQLTLKLLNRNK